MKRTTLPTLASAAFAAALLIPAAPAAAHCDSVEGPVVLDAKAALEKGDVAPVLKWISAAQEPAVRESFQRTLAVRKLSAEAREVADTAFFETLVRLHRETEGAAYTGLPLTIDGNIITGEALGAAIPFALAIARELAGADAAARVKKAIVYQ